MLSDRAKEFVYVSDDILSGERALQSRDGKEPDEWQVICLLSAFINYVGERERLRYGHFAFDLDPSNNPSRERDAKTTFNRMKIFWNYFDDDVIGELTDIEEQERKVIFKSFIQNDHEIQVHLSHQPDFYAEGIDQTEHRSWMLKLRMLGEKEKSIIKSWNKLVEEQRANRSKILQTSELRP